MSFEFFFIQRYFHHEVPFSTSHLFTSEPQDILWYPEKKYLYILFYSRPAFITIFIARVSKLTNRRAYLFLPGHLLSDSQLSISCLHFPFFTEAIAVSDYYMNVPDFDSEFRKTGHKPCILHACTLV
jgi:hypothetical protein